MHELAELLGQNGAGNIAEQVDIGLIQETSISTLFRLAARLQSDPISAIAQVSHALLGAQEIRRSIDRERMSADRVLSFNPPPFTPNLISLDKPRTVFLTGGTGFLGPSLLTSIIQQTNARIYVLVRSVSSSMASERLSAALTMSAAHGDAFWRAFRERVIPICGDLEQPKLGLDAQTWSQLAKEVDTIYHSGAAVNYLHNYSRMRGANVRGTNEVLKFAFEGNWKILNYISTTFIFGWARKHILYESDSNEKMELLDFGYSQSKWVAEQIVAAARSRGLVTRIFRPSLITPSVAGDANSFDISLRLLLFMIKHGIGVEALNQVSFVPADIVANNIVAISNCGWTSNKNFHVTRDAYANMIDIVNVITKLTGHSFTFYKLPKFVPEVIRRCTRDDLLFPLLDFLVGSIDNISAMESKRYDNSAYQRARDASSCGKPDPSLDDTVMGILRFMHRKKMVHFDEFSHQISPELGRL
jgi:thioester reductase-like protein